MTELVRLAARILRQLADELAPDGCPLCELHASAILHDQALIDVRVAAEGLPWLAEWTACEGIRLVEQPDGTYELYLTANLEQAQIAQLEEILKHPTS